MIRWAEIKATMASQIARLTHLDPKQVRWLDEPVGPVWGNVPMVYLRRIANASIGMYEERRTDDDLAPAGDQSVTMVRQKLFTVSVRAESFTQDLGDPAFAGNIIDLLETRIYRTTAVEDRLGLFAIVGNEPIRFFDYTAEGRQISCHVLDLRCATVDNDNDDTDDAGGWIQRVQGTGTLYGVDNTDVIATISEDVKS